MKKNHPVESERNSNNRFIYIFSVVSIIPLIAIFIIYNTNPNSTILHYIYKSSINFPAITSAKNPLMSRAMSTYCKTAPLFSLIWFLFSINKLTPPVVSKIKSIKVSICCTILFLISIITFLFFNHELTTSGRMLRALSTNDFLLLFFYSTLYISLSTFTYMALVSYYLVHHVFKGRM